MSRGRNFPEPRLPLSKVSCRIDEISRTLDTITRFEERIEQLRRCHVH